MAYRIMFHLGVCDILQAIGYGIMGMMMITDSSFGNIAAQITAGWIHCFWFGLMCFAFVLSFNRFEVFLELTVIERMMSSLGSSKNRFYQNTSIGVHKAISHKVFIASTNFGLYIA
uniref:Uncharacterized protein n=1 Tax=Acrobeloides nanus TaxID=290746 RepID=A0A914DY54_9BILA